MKFYFTYGTEGQPFVGGWTEVEAPSLNAAEEVFILFHPCRDGNLLNCSSVYTEERFVQTEMYRNGNYGKRCVETISLRRTVEN